MVEKEKKVLLNLSEYNTLNDRYKWTNVNIQKNLYYYNEYTKANDITVRIRLLKDKKLLQIKYPLFEQNALHVKQEYQKEVTKIEDNIKNEIIEDICQYNLGDTKLIGKLTTLRKRYCYNENVTICLDKNSYLGIEDYELEIEYAKEEPRDLIAELMQINILFDKKIKGKSRRFIDRYDGIKCLKKDKGDKI